MATSVTGAWCLYLISQVIEARRPRCTTASGSLSHLSRMRPLPVSMHISRLLDIGRASSRSSVRPVTERLARALVALTAPSLFATLLRIGR
jgi:hypothetical protein